MSKLPPYLEELDIELPAKSIPRTPCTNAVFRHTKFPSVSHALWWPSKNVNKSTTCFLFITGNPGLIDFYTPFLTALHNKLDRSMSLFGHGFSGHTPNIEFPLCVSSTSLAAQIQGVLEIIDALKEDHSRIIVAGHSVGSWVALQALKERPECISAAFLLFPTICHIVDTPNGHNFARFFRSPFPGILSRLSVLLRVVPTRVLAILLFRDWPSEQLQVLRAFLNSPKSICASLSMAHEEMVTIKDLDVSLLQEHRHIIHLYFAENDDWVGKQKDAILGAFEVEGAHVRVVHGHKDIPHAFCINHGEPVADQCYRWLRDAIPDKTST